MTITFKLKRLRIEFKNGNLIEFSDPDIDYIDIYNHGGIWFKIEVHYNVKDTECYAISKKYSYKLEMIKRYEVRYCNET